MVPAPHKTKPHPLGSTKNTVFDLKNSGYALELRFQNTLRDPEQEITQGILFRKLKANPGIQIQQLITSLYTKPYYWGLFLETNLQQLLEQSHKTEAPSKSSLFAKAPPQSSPSALPGLGPNESPWGASWEGPGFPTAASLLASLLGSHIPHLL